MKERLTALGFLVVGMAVLVAVVLAGLATRERLERASASTSWPTTDGVVSTAAAVGKNSLRLRFRYTVDGVEYEGRRVRVSQTLDRDRRAELLDRYTEGQRVVVAYDPAEPSFGVLEPGSSGEAWGKAAIGFVVMALVGLGLVAVGVSSLRD